MAHFASVQTPASHGMPPAGAPCEHLFPEVFPGILGLYIYRASDRKRCAIF